MRSVTLVHRDFMQMTPHDYYAREGESLEQMAKRVTTLPEGWPRHEHDAVCINGHPIPRALWGMIKPRAASKSGVRNEITFHAPPMGGGGGGGGKNVIGLIASIGLIALSGGVASGITLLAGGGVGTTASILGTASRAVLLGRLAGAAVLIGGNAVLQALAPTPSVPRPSEGQSPRALGSASAQGNILDPNGSLPRVVGTRKIFPPFVTEPFIYFDGNQEVVEAVAALAGPHKMESIRVGDAAIESVEGVEFETREGWPGVEPLSLISRYARTIEDGTPIQRHLTSEENRARLESPTNNILDALPAAKVIVTRDAPDEFWIGILLQQGLDISTNPGAQPLRIPMRMRMRLRGTDIWTVLPEIHFQDARIGPRRATIKFVWRDASANISAASNQGWVEARIVSPGQAISPNTNDWISDSYFDADAGGAHYVTSTNANSSDVRNVIMSDNVAEFQLDRAIFPPGAYEVEIRRGYTFLNASYSPAAYTLGGQVRDPFHFEGAEVQTIFQTQKDLIEELTLLRYNSVWNEPPVRTGDVALIAIKAREARIDRLSVLASGYVRDWDGEAWAEWTTTSNPAPHIRDALTGPLNATPLPEAVIDDDSLLEFRADNWTCDAISEGTSIRQAVAVMAGSGYAQLYQSERVGLIRDRDRSNDSPVQVFTPNNMSDFSWSRGYPRLPDGFRATFADETADFEPLQIIHPEGATRTEQTTIEGLIRESDVRARLQYDLDAARYRAVFYSWQAAAEAIKCRRGSLVGVVADTLSARSFFGRVADFDFNADGDVTAVRLENEADLAAEPRWSEITGLASVNRMSLISARFGLVIRRKGQVATVHQVSKSERGPEWLELVTPANLPDLDYGDLSAVGPLGKEFRRLIVVDISGTSLTEWTITAVPEAPQLWQ